MSYCVNCGNKITDEIAKFCSECGHSINKSNVNKNLVVENSNNVNEVENIDEDENNFNESVLDEVIDKAVGKVINDLITPIEFTSTFIYTHPNIPGKKFFNFIKNFDPITDYKALVYYDITFFGKGDQGLAVIENGENKSIYLRNKQNMCFIFNCINDGSNDIELFFISREGTTLLFYGCFAKENEPFTIGIDTTTQKCVDELYYYLIQNTKLNSTLSNKYFN